MTYQIILPSIYPPYTEACLATMHQEVRDNTLVWDNTKNNIGVAASWNKGIEEMKRRNADWFITVSATMRFGKEGGMDLIRQLEKTELVVAEPEMGHGWHLMSLHRSIIDRVGTFDENFYPAYFEDTDYAQRIRYAFDHKLKWAKIYIDVSSMGNAHGVTLAGVRALDGYMTVQEYYVKKWGGVPGQQKYTTPFNSGRDISWWEKIN